MNKLIIVGIVAALSREAAADQAGSDYERVATSLKQTAPARGIDKAPAGAPGWCTGYESNERVGAIARHLDSYYADPPNKFYELVATAGSLCGADPKLPITQQAAREVLQLWMNHLGLSAADATESMNLVIDKKRRDASKKELCQALAIDKEVGGAARAFLQAKRELFNCPGGTDDAISELGGNQKMARLVPWMDSSATPPDELVRLALVSLDLEGFADAHEDFKQKLLLVYGLDQFDIKSLDPKKAVAMADVAPFKDNAFARVMIKERLAQVRVALMTFDDAVKKQTEKDPAWKELLVTAPQKGAADYLAGAKDFAAELQRSADFEQAAFGPSRKAIANCYPTLKKDLVAVLKPMKRETATELVAEMNKSSVAGLLFRRVQACIAGSGDASQAIEMRKLSGIRVIRGPRQAAYYAMIDALGKIRADRTKFAIEERDIPFAREDILAKLTYQLAENGVSAGIGDYHVWTGKGVVKTAKKGKDGTLAVVFATDKQQIWEQSCKQLNRIIMFDHDMRPIYDQSCTGKVVTADVSPDPITVPAHLADGVKPGRLMTFGISNSQEKRISMPFEVYADKKGKKLVAWYGIGID